jgi:hypothetical protein
VTLANGGRSLSEETPTAPDGIYLLQTDSNGVETGRLLVSNDESDALSAGFTEQACFHGMGMSNLGLQPASQMQSTFPALNR